MTEEIRKRANALNAGLGAISQGWPFLIAELDQQIAQFTAQLVNANDEETRGRIKALVDIRNLPETLALERDGLTTALSEQSDAA